MAYWMKNPEEVPPSGSQPGRNTAIRTAVPTTGFLTGLFRKCAAAPWILSIALQIPFAVFFGHYYDDRIFMATGYLAATGQNPYLARDLSAVFHNPDFQSFTTIGYPPPWALILGLAYRLAAAVSTNLLFYNLVLKIPILAANLGLAWLTVRILKRLGAGEPVTAKARNFLLFNPFLIYFAVAWGQFDSIVAFFSLLAILLLDEEKPGRAGIILALAVSLKPTAFPLLLVFLFRLAGKSWPAAVRFSAAFATGILAFCILPFPVFGWDPAPILRDWNYHFNVAGAMSIFAVYTLWSGTMALRGIWEVLGFLWIPALAIGALVLRRASFDRDWLIRMSAGMTLIFFLSRSWLSEPNLILLLPMIVILVSLGSLPARALTAVWVIPFVFTVFFASFPQLLFPLVPGILDRLQAPTGALGNLVTAVRFGTILLWFAAGIWIILLCMKKDPAKTDNQWK